MAGPFSFFRLIAPAALALVAACTAQNEITEPPVDLGDFELGYNIVVADNAEIVPPSRGATPDEWEAALTAAIDKRLRRYDGEKLYHLGVAVDGFALAIPGVPVVVSPKSAVIISVNLWDDATESKLTEEPKRLTVLESFTGETVIGSGLTKTREQQMENLAFNAAAAIERYLEENAAQWFGSTVAADAAAELPAAAEAPAETAATEEAGTAN